MRLRRIQNPEFRMQDAGRVCILNSAFCILHSCGYFPGIFTGSGGAV
jgi:hypothetical protein